MVPILVLATFIVIALGGWYLQKRREMIAEAARAHGPIPIPAGGTPGQPSADFLFHPGHTWVYVHDDGLVSVGATDFATNFAGQLSAVEMPGEGARLHQGDSAWTLVSAKDRRLDQVMPIEGKVLAVNSDLLENPELAQSSPYEEGWILRVRPRELKSSIRNLLSAEASRIWIDATRTKISALLSPALGALAHDGGQWIAGFGDRLEDSDWENLKQDLFSAAAASQAEGESG